METTLTIKLKNKKAKKLIEDLVDLDLISVVAEPDTIWSTKKKKQAKEFIDSYKQAQKAEKGEIKLKSAKSLLNEL
jgi:hypothetical protein